MSTYRFAIASPILGLCSIALTLLVWAWIRAQPTASFHDQGAMTVTLICFPLTLLGWLVFGGPALVLGLMGLTWREVSEHAVGARLWGVAGVVIGLAGLALSPATLALV